MIRVTNETHTIYITGEIGEGWFSEGYTIDKFLEDIKTLENQPLTVLISSTGGDLGHALAIYDLLRARKEPVTTEIVGATASAASVIAMAGSVRKMHKNAMLLIHNAMTQVQGNAAALQAVASDLEMWDERIIDIYTSRTGKQKEEIQALMAQERWMPATEALEWGFVTEIVEPIQNSIQTPKNQTDMDEKDQKIQELETQLAATQQDNTTLKEKIKELEAKIAELEMQQATGESSAMTENNMNLAEAIQALEDARRVIDRLTPRRAVDAMKPVDYKSLYEKFLNDWKAGKYVNDPEGFSKAIKQLKFK